MSTTKAPQPTWFEEKIQPHEHSLRAYLRAAFPALPDLDDLVQETYLRLIRANQTGRISYARAFLFATARNAALDLFRRRKIVTFETMGNAAALSFRDESPDASEALNKQDELAMLAEAIKSLPARCRQAVTLRMLYGLPAKEIAGRLGISECTVKAQLAKGMRRCEEYFVARGMMDSRPATEADR